MKVVFDGDLCRRSREETELMQQKSNAERRKQLVRTMNELGDVILQVDELAKDHADNAAAGNGFRHIITSIKAARDVLQAQYNELLSSGVNT